MPGGAYQEHWTTTGNRQTVDGAVKLTPREGERGWSRWSAYLWSKKEHQDFEIQFDYKVEERGNSGFYFRVGDRNSLVGTGIEVFEKLGRGPVSLPMWEREHKGPVMAKETWMNFTVE